MRKIILFIYCTTITHCAFSQINNRFLEQRNAMWKPIQQKLLLDVYSSQFLKNNEYFNDIATGYTLFGTQLSTQLAYVPKPFLRIQGGVYMRKDFGNPKITQVTPLFTVKLSKKGYSLLFGNYEGNLNHRLIEPLFNYENYITQPIESGLQLLVAKKKYWSDTWLNWEVQQYPLSSFKERLTGGHHSSIAIYKNDTAGITIKLPIQLLVHHIGGQLDTLPEPLSTALNTAIGITVEKKYGKNNWLNALKTENYYCHYSLSTSSTLPIFKQGSGIFFNASAVLKHHVTFSIGYWQGNQFVAPKGGYLYQSVSSIANKKMYSEKERKLAFIRLLYQRKIVQGLNADVRFEPYYDLKNKLFEYSYSFYLTYKKDFILKRIKPISSSKS